MSIDDDIYAFFEHSGVKGMKWGVRRAVRKEHMKELSIAKNKNRAEEKASAANDPTFKREVKLTRQGKGLTIGPQSRLQKTENGKLLTGRILGEFKNSQGQKVSQEFASAVLMKSVRQNDHARKAKMGALFVAAAITGTAIGKLSVGSLNK